MKKSYFGVMLDNSRNAVMKISELKKFVDYISLFGYNSLFLYTEDTYEVKNEPYFGYMRGRYTAKELKELDAYCISKNIELVPCIQTLAHLNAIFKWEQYSDINDTNDILFVGEDRTYKLIENMFETISECYTTRIVNIGMDEAHFLGLGKYLDKHGFENRSEIFAKHIVKVTEIAEKYGFKSMIWSDMFFRLANKGNYYGKEKISQKIKDIVPKNVDLVYWDYYHSEVEQYNEIIDAHRQFENDIWFAGGAYCWRGFAPSNAFSLKTMLPAMQSCRQKGIDKIMITMWGDAGKECSFYSLLPSLFHISKAYCGEVDIQKIKKEFYELTGEDYDALYNLDLPNRICGNEGTQFNPSKYILYSDLFNGFMDATLPDGAEVEFNSFAKRLRQYAKNSKFNYIFDMEAKLCDVLEIKYSLGKKLRIAYQNGDKKTLKKLYKSIKETKKRLQTFYYSFRNLWFKENKPHGFDVQDVHLGGAMRRIKSCRERLKCYLDGRIESIPELEEKLLDFYKEGEQKRFTFSIKEWKDFVSVNPMA